MPGRTSVLVNRAALGRALLRVLVLVPVPVPVPVPVLVLVLTAVSCQCRIVSLRTLVLFLSEGERRNLAT